MMQFFYCAFHWYPNIQRQISNNALLQMHAGAIRKLLYYMTFWVL